MKNKRIAALIAIAIFTFMTSFNLNSPLYFPILRSQNGTLSIAKQFSYYVFR